MDQHWIVAMRFSQIRRRLTPGFYNRMYPFFERVTIAAGIHLFPFRTEKLSPPAPMVLQGRLCGRVGRRPFSFSWSAGQLVNGQLLAGAGGAGFFFV